MLKNPVCAKWKTVEADAGCVGERIPKGWRDWDDRCLAGGFRAERTVGVVGVGKEDLGAGNIGEGRDAVVAEGRIDHFSVVVEDHALEQTAADALRNRPLDLPAALHGVEDRSGVRGVDALQDANFSGDPIHGDTKAMHVEAGSARRPVSFAHHAQPMPRVGDGLEELGQRDRPRATFHRAIHEAALLERSGGELWRS